MPFHAVGGTRFLGQHHRSGLCRRVARYREGAVAGLFGVADRRDFAEVPLVALPGLVHLRIARLLIVLGLRAGRQ